MWIRISIDFRLLPNFLPSYTISSLDALYGFSLFKNLPRFLSMLLLSLGQREGHLCFITFCKQVL